MKIEDFKSDHITVIEGDTRLRATRWQKLRTQQKHHKILPASKVFNSISHDKKYFALYDTVKGYWQLPDQKYQKSRSQSRPDQGITCSICGRAGHCVEVYYARQCSKCKKFGQDCTSKKDDSDEPHHSTKLVRMEGNEIVASLNSSQLDQIEGLITLPDGTDVWTSLRTSRWSSDV